MATVFTVHTSKFPYPRHCRSKKGRFNICKEGVGVIHELGCAVGISLLGTRSPGPRARLPMQPDYSSRRPDMRKQGIDSGRRLSFCMNLRGARDQTPETRPGGLAHDDAKIG
jgi:hypothetical protein